MFSSLQDVRQRVLGYSLESALHFTGIPLKRFNEIEAGADPSVHEAEAISSAYGIDAEILFDSSEGLSPTDVVAALASGDEFRHYGDFDRFRIVRVSKAIRDLAKLRALLELNRPELPRLFSRNPGSTDPPYAQGREVAQTVRQKLGPAANPILSMTAWLKEKLPAVDLLYSHLGNGGPAGLTFAGQNFGPTIVLNLDGKNTNPCVRRFSLAHEIYHVIADWDPAESLAILSDYVSDGTALEREQRANGFASRFLVPESALLDLAGRPQEGEIVQTLITTWGLHYSAARLHIRNVLNIDLPHVPSPQWETGVESWGRHEPAEGEIFPLPNVPNERRTLVAQLAAHAYSRGLIQRDRFAEYLGIFPTEDLETVLNFFGVDIPQAA
jgi:Zn-dependent peptidase ImmA (M78 family)